MHSLYRKVGRYDDIIDKQNTWQAFNIIHFHWWILNILFDYSWQTIKSANSP